MIIDNSTQNRVQLIIEHPDCMLRILFIIKGTIRLIHTVSLNLIFSCNVFPNSLETISNHFVKSCDCSILRNREIASQDLG